MHELSITQGLVDAVLNRTGERTTGMAQRCARPLFPRVALLSSGHGEAINRRGTGLMSSEAP